MKRVIVLLLPVLVLLGTSVSCSEDFTPKPLTFTKLFTGETNKTWDLSKVQSREKNKNVVTYNLSSCQGDDRYTFYANAERLYEVTNGRNSCDAGEEDLLVSYTWEYNSASATLNLVLPHLFGNFIVPFTVMEIDDDDMILELALNDDSTTAYILYFTKIDEN